MPSLTSAGVEGIPSLTSAGVEGLPSLTSVGVDVGAIKTEPFSKPDQLSVAWRVRDTFLEAGILEVGVPQITPRPPHESLVIRTDLESRPSHTGACGPQDWPCNSGPAFAGPLLRVDSPCGSLCFR